MGSSSFKFLISSVSWIFLRRVGMGRDLFESEISSSIFSSINSSLITGAFSAFFLPRLALGLFFCWSFFLAFSSSWSQLLSLLIWTMGSSSFKFLISSVSWIFLRRVGMGRDLFESEISSSIFSSINSSLMIGSSETFESRLSATALSNLSCRITTSIFNSAVVLFSFS